MKLVSLHSKREKEVCVIYLVLPQRCTRQPSLIHMIRPLTLNNIRLTSGYYSWILLLAFSIPHIIHLSTCFCLEINSVQNE